MTAQQKFQQMLKTLTPTLKEHGYSKRGTVFRKRCGDNWGVIGFIKDKWNTPESVRFSIEIGVYSLAIDKQLEWDILPKAPSTPHCHWRKDVESNLAIPGHKSWWDIDQYTNTDTLTEAVKNKILNIALPEIDSHITDEQLKDHWLAGGAGALSRFNKLRQLSILLKLFNEKDKLEQVLHQIEQEYGSDDEFIRAHLKKMREEPLNE